MHKKLAGIAMLLGVTMAASAQAEMWSCEYDGSWSTFNSNDKGQFNWSVIWQSKAGGGWGITGDYTDRYGNSVLNGNCNDHVCNLTQMYQSGEFNGKRYFWKGKYSDQASGSAKTINRFEGTWGSTPDVGEGSWRAIATCTRN